MKVGLTGSRTWSNNRMIKEIIFKLKQQFGDDLEIISCGETLGADKAIKKYALEFDCKYGEFNVAHSPRNLYSRMPEHFYDKPFAPKNYYVRNSIYTKSASAFILFIDKSTPVLDGLIKLLNKNNKKFIIYN